MDVQRLLTETLADPRRRVEPGPADLVELRAGLSAARRRRSRRRWVPAVAVAITGVAVLALTIGSGPPPAPGRAATPAVTGSINTSVRSDGPVIPAPWRFTGVPVEVAAGADGLWALQISPARVVRLDPVGGRILAAADLPSDDTRGLLLDEQRSVVWAWGVVEDHTVLVELDAATLRSRRTLTVPDDTSSAVVVDGSLFLATGASLLRIDPGAAAGVPVPGVHGGYGMVADQQRGRLYVSSGTQLVSVDVRAGRVLANAASAGVKISLALSGDGQLWLGRYAYDVPLIAHVDPDTLREIGTSPLAVRLGPGAVVSAGRSVIWVRNNGEAPLTCIDARSGRVLADWISVTGPVADRPVGGRLIAKSGPALVQLPVSAGCSG